MGCHGAHAVKLSEWPRRMMLPLRALEDSLFPPTCWVTGRPVRREDRGLSPQVRRRLEQFIAAPFCRRCGATLGPWASPAGCQRCAQRRLGVGEMIRAGPLQEPLGRLIRRLKFQRLWAVGPLLAEQVYTAMRYHGAAPVDVWVPVPLHWRRRWRRGFNQAEEIAAALGRLSQRPMAAGALVRRRGTAPQTATVSRTARLANLQGAFIARIDPRLAGRQVWLVDDVCTTGATLHAAAAALKALPGPYRPASINAAVVAVTDSTPIPGGETF